MSTRLRIHPDDILPTAGDILRQQKVPRPERADAVLVDIADRARRELEKVLAPAGLLVALDVAGFPELYRGLGRNESRTPLDSIAAQAAALFAVTVGQAVSDRIERIFAERDFALAAALDAAASLAADAAAAQAEKVFTARQEAQGLAAARYSPGYCGWHVSGQEALFAALDPATIGLELTESYLMRPLKSVSGVILAGEPEIHVFEADFPFCAACTDRSCRERIARFRKE